MSAMLDNLRSQLNDSAAMRWYLGREPNDEVTIDLPSGTVRYRVVGIEALY